MTHVWEDASVSSTASEDEIDLEKGRSEVGDEIRPDRRSLDVSIRAERAYY